jgi:hypothetical protein
MKTLKGTYWFMVWVMTFNATFKNISAISWWSVLLVKETGVPGEKHRSVASNSQALGSRIFESPQFFLSFEKISYFVYK